MYSNNKGQFFNCIGKGKYEVFGDFEIGRGGFGLVYLAKARETNKLCAIKVQILTDSVKRVFEQEVFYLASLRCSNIVEFIESYCINFSGQEMGIIVMEKMDTDLMEYKLSGARIYAEDVKRIFKSMCESVAYCHSKNIAHFDIKLENYLLKVGDANANNLVHTVKLCDFGSAKEFPGSFHSKTNNSITPHGTSEYLPPEMHNFTNFQIIEEKVDIWSLGVSLCILITGRYPFSSDFNELNNLYDNLMLLFRESYVNPLLIDLLLSIFKVNPRDRTSTFQMLSHPWFNY